MEKKHTAASTTVMQLKKCTNTTGFSDYHTTQIQHFKQTFNATAVIKCQRLVKGYDAGDCFSAATKSSSCATENNSTQCSIYTINKRSQSTLIKHTALRGNNTAMAQ